MSRQRKNTSLASRAQQSAPRGKPRTRMSSSTFTDVIKVSNKVVSPLVTVNTNGDAEVSALVNPALNGNGPLTSVATCYEQYKAEVLHFHWQPTVGFTTSGVISIGYIDNPEVIKNWGTYPAAHRYAIIRSLPNVVTSQIFDPVTLVVNRPLRRKWFASDNTIPITDGAAVDRAVQGMYVVYITGVNSGGASIGVGNFVLQERHTLSGLINPLASTTSPALVKGNEGISDRIIVWPTPTDADAPLATT